VRLIIVLTFTAALVGCASLYEPMMPIYSLNPSVSPDGDKKFNFVITENHSAYDSGSPNEAEKLRVAFLESELGRQHLCQNGYIIEKRYSTTNGFLVYDGVCR